MKQVSYSRSARKALQRIPGNIAQLIVAKINRYASDPASLASNVKMLKGEFEGLIRPRVGDWRIIMDDQGNVLMILEIKPRGGAYERHAESQIIISPSGERMVVLPESDYAALIEQLEDAEDIASANAVIDKIRRGQEEMVPAYIVERLAGGENPITVWREYRGMTISALAEKAGLSQSYLSQIESGKREGKVTMLARLARTLSIDLDDLVTIQAE